MKITLFKFLTGFIFLSFAGCTSVQFYSNQELTKKSGLNYYTVKPCLQVD